MDHVEQLGKELADRRAFVINVYKMADTGQVDPDTGATIYDGTKLTPQMAQDFEAELAVKERAYQAARMAKFGQENAEKYKELHKPEYKYGAPIRASAGDVSDYTRNAEKKLLSDWFMDSVEYKGRQASPRRYTVTLPDFDVKTLFIEPHLIQEQQRQAIGVQFPLRPLRVADIIPSTTTEANIIRYMEQTVFGDSAATVSESGVKPEGQTEWVERSDEVEKIAIWLPVTEEAMADVPQLRMLLDEYLREAVRREEEDQLLSGNGTRPNLLGFLTKTGVQTQARGADSNADAIFKAFTLVRWTSTAFAEPSAVVIHPNNWETIRLSKTTGDGAYLFGQPYLTGFDTLWGKPVVVTPAITANTALTGDFQMFSRIFRKTGLRVDVSDSHSDYFIYNKLAIRAEERLTLVITRAAAFAKVTGLN